MPLRDHFHPPLTEYRTWEAFHTHWASALAGRLNDGVLTSRFVAEPQLTLASRIEVDVTLSPEVWAPPEPTAVLATTFPDELEIQILAARNGMRLVAAVELLSEGNKDRPESRQQFADKCAAYLHQRIGLVIVDIVTSRLANLHNLLCDHLRLADAPRFTPEQTLYAVAYRPVRRPEGDRIDCWTYPFALGQVLPTVPLAVKGGPTFPLELEFAYADACRRARI